ncbi:FYVE, RhoGEF and PH domain-containing protein 5 isoform X2 [Sinocyclocheilus grahami]|uniref:FYVE, RhoGEF and PH domain-containing protein 5 isoform X2 n=1 Tax=Sinocyclocheilus grahami TaxID=75366 RepID=UPI0007ACAB11|nr:PREDICTED: FYVE, RhoGEF and PH domain-containing protein 5-like isoform X2 [Sinocyclocheilus grahami]
MNIFRSNSKLINQRQSHLTITVCSTLMSRPCPSTRGPKPPVAPKPRQASEVSQSIVGNGYITSSDRLELNQDNESDVTQDEADASRENCTDDDVDLSDKVFTVNYETNHDTSCYNEIEEELQMAVDETVGGRMDEGKAHQATEIQHSASSDLLEVVDESLDSADEDHSKNTHDTKPAENGEYAYNVLEDTCAFSENETLIKDQPAGESQSPYEEIQDPSSDGFYRANDQYEEDTRTGAKCVHEAQEDETGLSSKATNCSQPSLCEEYPYDVIGTLDDNSTWQAERATKDPSGRFRFAEETEDAFEPYSVIEVVPSDLTCTSDPEARCTDDESSNEKPIDSEIATEATSNQEPYYVSSDDVAELEQEQVKLENGVSQHASEGQEMTKNEEVDDYADIKDNDGDDQQVECVSSEDYVEIGDEDEPVNLERKTKCKSIRERSARRGQAHLSQRNSCQPRLRLCNITVPADLDVGRTPELTNRVVFAHTTEAFEEDIEELDCHIVPFFEDSDTESDEHIYEEAGFDSEGENFISLDRKSIVTRSRSLSGKVPGYVPETVPEETGTEYQSHDYYTVALDQNGVPHPKLSDETEANRVIPSLKPRRFLLSPRSLSVEGRDLPFSGHFEGEKSPREECRLQKKNDTLSLPCVITSSGSFSQRSHQSSSGVSTPTSLVDIPPPFELAYITKRPVTKSSPSLLIQHESPDNPQKKKTSFKRFLALKFKKKSESKARGDGSVRSSRSSSESSHHGPIRVLELDRRSTSGSPQLQSLVGKPQRNSEIPATFLLYKERQRRQGAPKSYSNRGIARVESFEDRSRPPFMALPLTKPRSISFPSADTSDYENIPAISSDYENIQIPHGRPTRAVTITEFFDDHNRTSATANENDGYVDMNSFAGIENKPTTQEQDPESDYTEPFPVCSVSATVSNEEDHGHTSEEEDGCGDHCHDRQIDGRSRAYYVAKDLVDSEREHVKALKILQEDFRAAVESAGDEEPLLENGKLDEILSTLPQAYHLHNEILNELETRIKQWEDSPSVVDVILTRRAEMSSFATYISDYDRSMSLLEESCRQRKAFEDVVKRFETQNAEGVHVPVKHQLLRVIVRVLQYRMILTDYLNNLSPDSKEYEDTQAALVIVSEVADQVNDNLKHGENLLRLVHIDYSVRGKRDLLQPGRVFVKEGTLMKVSRKSRQPRHVFLMNDVMLYTYPQQDGKYRLKNTLTLSGMKVSKPVIDNVLHTLKIEVSDVTITLSASSLGEREDWFHTLSRAIADHAAGLNTFSCSSEAREKLWMSLGEAAPVLVPVSHVMMCMNCTSDFRLTLRRHHCNACGKVVCRSCSRNRYPLKYLKDRIAKVCDHCYAELRKRGGNIPGSCGSTSPHTNRASRPLSAVFQSLQPPSLWRNRKSTSPLTQVSVGAEGSTMSGSLQRRKKSKRKWKRLWFLLKDKDKVASESLPLQGFTVKLSDRSEGEDKDNVFQLYHKKTLYYTFRADDQHTARRWVNAMEEATVL